MLFMGNYRTFRASQLIPAVNNPPANAGDIRDKKCKKAWWFSEEALQIAKKRRNVKGKGEKGKYIHLNTAFECRVPKNSKER